MGGVINVAVRFRSGETVCQERWTNAFPHWFTDPKMFEGDEEHVRAYLFGQIHNNDKIADPHAGGQPHRLQNNEYGLFVWDYVTNTILDNNGYSSADNFDPIHTGGEDVRENFVKCANDSRIFKKTTTYHYPTYQEQQDHILLDAPLPPQPPNIVDIGPILSPADALAMGELEYRNLFKDRKGDGSVHQRVAFMIDTRPMTYLKLPERSSMQEKLRELGFPMSAKEGLNVTWAPFWKKQRPLYGRTKQEIVARQLYQSYKREEAGRELDGKPFEDLTEDSRQALMSLSSEWLLNPEKFNGMAMTQVFEPLPRLSVS